MSLEIDMAQFLTADGNIDYGQIMRFWRKEVRGWSNAQTLADLHNEFMDDSELVSIRWVQRVEKTNKVPIDLKRRWVLATLLNIPPAVFGLTALKSIIPHPDDFMMSMTTKIEPVNSEVYQARLKQLWSSWMSVSPQQSLMEELLSRIHCLENALLYGGSQQKNEMGLLLCHYLILCGNICRDLGRSDTAILYLDKALAISNEKNYREMSAKALYLRGYAYFDKWGIRPNKANNTDLVSAMHNFRTASQFTDASKNGPLMSAIVAELGLCQAYSAYDKQDRGCALAAIDQAGSIIGSRGFTRDPYFLHVNDEWYHIDKSEAFLAMGWPKAAIEELTNINRGDPHTRRRYVYTDVIESEAFVARGQIEMGVACAENALLYLGGENCATTFVSRIVRLHESFKQNEKYRNSPDVARLGVRLLQIQHPELFA